MNMAAGRFRCLQSLKHLHSRRGILGIEQLARPFAISPLFSVQYLSTVSQLCSCDQVPAFNENLFEDSVVAE